MNKLSKIGKKESQGQLKKDNEIATFNWKVPASKYFQVPAILYKHDTDEDMTDSSFSSTSYTL